MDLEEEILAFGETVLWVECDVCGSAYGGPGVKWAVIAVGQANICVECLRKGGRRGAVEKK